MTGTFLGASVFFFPPNAARGASSVSPSRNTKTSRLLRLRIRLGLASDILCILLIELPPRQIFVAAGTKRQIVGLVLDQQIGLRRGMRLVARQAVDLRPGLGNVGRSTTSETGCPSTGC